MNQTKKRLAIVNLAISITDIETIQLQSLKLSLLKSDKKISEILNALNEQNYAQAQQLIAEYIEAPNDTVVQRTSQGETNTKEAPSEQKENTDQEIIEEFDLFTTPAYTQTEDNQEASSYDSFLEDAIQTNLTTPTTKEVNYDPLLNMEARDILTDNIDLDISQNESAVSDKTDETKKVLTKSDNTAKENKTVPDTETTDTNTNQDIKESENQTNIHTEDQDDSHYEPIPHINKRFNNLYEQYPPIEHTQSRFYSVENWLLQVSTKGYTEKEVEARIEDAQRLKENNLAEAAQLIIAAGATDSLYALFRLARELYIGDILQKNIPEAVTLIHYLAVNEEYPEAICDLAQLYEQGIEVNKDRKKAEALYKEAMHFGIQRAEKHYQRIHKENKSFFARFLK